MKLIVNSIAAMILILRDMDPTEIFLEIKDGGFPLKAWANGLCLPGGNWVGKAAINDLNPFGTLRRELGEEFSILPEKEEPREELVLLGHIKTLSGLSLPTRILRAKIAPSPLELSLFAELRRYIALNCLPLVDCLATVPKTVLDSADPKNTREGYRALHSYWVVRLPENFWAYLLDFQNKFRNLSNESTTLFTSLGEIVEKKYKISFGHDWLVRWFYEALGCPEAKNVPIVPGVEVLQLGLPRSSYKDYEAEFEIVKKPA